MSEETVTIPRRLIEELAQYLTASEAPPPPLPGRIESTYEEHGTADIHHMASAPPPSRPGQIDTLVDAPHQPAHTDADEEGVPSATQAEEGGEFSFCRPRPR